LEQLDALVVDLRQQPLDGLAAHAKMGLYQPGNLRPRGQHRHHRQPRGGTKLIERIEVERVAGGHHQRAIALADGKEHFAVDVSLRKCPQQRQIDVGIGKVHILQAHLIGQCPQRLLFADEAKLHGDFIQALAVGLGIAHNFQLARVEQSTFQQYLADFHKLTPNVLLPA